MSPDALRALIARIKLADTDIKAWRAFPDENALNSPPNGDFQNAAGPLSGLTVGVKDIIDVAGIPTRHGSLIYEDALPAAADAECVALMRAAGATIVGKTVTTELATFVPSVTRNPRNLNHTPGGSSSGSAAAVAAGHVDIAIGTQTAGSIIRPAAYCGVFGFKPSFGLVPRGGVKIQSETLDTVGVFARSIEHCEAWLAAMTGANSRTTLTGADRASLRIRFISNWHELATDDVQTAVAGVAEALRDVGHDVLANTLPAPLAELCEHQTIIQRFEASRAYAPLCAQFPSLMTPSLLADLTQGSAIPTTRYEEAIAAVRSGRQIADEMLGTHDVWLMPSATDTAPAGLASTGDPFFNRLASVLGVCAITIPLSIDTRGLPTGLQLLARQGEDRRLLSIAHTLVNILCPPNSERTHGRT